MKNFPSLIWILGFILMIPGMLFAAGDVQDPFSDGTVAPADSPGVSPSVSPATPSGYVVKRGDTLSLIASQLLGDPHRFWEIVESNAGRYPTLRKNPNLIFSGWNLIIPGGTPQTQGTAPQPGQPSEADEPSSENSGGNMSGQDTRPIGIAPSPANVRGECFGNPPPAPSSKELINENTRVLHIGDSHTVGIYGTTMDELMRKTGAKVQTYGVAGSSPSWWWKGTTTKCGYFGRDDTGKVDRPADWRTPRQTPLVKNLLASFQPGVVVISLGANLVNAGETRIEQETQDIIALVKGSGARVIWVGPPRSREDAGLTKKKETLNRVLEETTRRNDVPFIDSRPLTHYPASGGDGLHYWGPEGTKTATAWANQVFSRIQKIPRR